ncbi:glycoside hydrolase family 53 protein [Geofilum rubicundum]|uniref:Arabinogalactan endo-beta-1,4-galactanase n=1 Tax=Geofilum rubicundum JCM 15548 TaxID=1236989 RepID=A0A0E9LU02_9BACT|nr:glycosyl hydrolase 53 family protein [Geofilum rubicundum]GAO28611.1 arabinogalactan endo-1,4-beta-galactosidase [Geofilum rubicundum JCM 15548]
MRKIDKALQVIFLFGMALILNLSAAHAQVDITFRVNMQGQDVSSGVFITGELNDWAFTPLTQEGETDVYQVTLSLTSGAQYIYYYKPTAAWDNLRETVPVECANSHEKDGGWEGDRMITVPATNKILDVVYYGGCYEAPIVTEPGEPSFDYILGVDLSYINQVEDHGGVYKENDVQADPYQLMGDKGANLSRIRLWHSPDWVKDVYGASTTVYSGFQDVARSIERSHNAGMQVLLDFHYSDTWADPGHQDVPVAWRNITSLEVLCDSVYNYTYATLSDLQALGLLPEMVQIGNETNHGMMITNTPAGFPSLNVHNGQWASFGKVVNAGIQAVRDIEAEHNKEIVVALHVADPKNLASWTGNVINQGKVTDFEIMGFSYYHIWHTDVSFDALPGLVSNVKQQYNKEIVIMETAYPFTTGWNDHYNNIYTENPLEGFPYTVEGQKDFLTTLNQNILDAGGMGVIYWEPAWISSNMEDLWGVGSSWENCAFFDFDGNLTSVVDYFDFASGIPNSISPISEVGSKDISIKGYKDYVSVEIKPELLLRDTAIMELLDLSGRTIKRRQTSEAKTYIQSPHKGLHFVRVSVANQMVIEKIMIL